MKILLVHLHFDFFNSMIFIILFGLMPFQLQAQKTSDHSLYFDVVLDVEKLDEYKYCLSITLLLEDDVYTLSPFSNDEFYSPTKLSIDPKNSNFILGKLEESPRSLIEFDNIIERHVRFVKQNTIYKLDFTWEATSEERIEGIFELLIEPACIPYDVKFSLISNGNSVSVKKINTLISPEYNG